MLGLNIQSAARVCGATITVPTPCWQWQPRQHSVQEECFLPVSLQPYTHWLAQMGGGGRDRRTGWQHGWKGRRCVCSFVFFLMQILPCVDLRV